MLCPVETHPDGAPRLGIGVQQMGTQCRHKAAACPLKIGQKHCAGRVDHLSQPRQRIALRAVGIELCQQMRGPCVQPRFGPQIDEVQAGKMHDPGRIQPLLQVRPFVKQPLQSSPQRVNINALFQR